MEPLFNESFCVMKYFLEQYNFHSKMFLFKKKMSLQRINFVLFFYSKSKNNCTVTYL